MNFHLKLIIYLSLIVIGCNSNPLKIKSGNELLRTFVNKWNHNSETISDTVRPDIISLAYIDTNLIIEHSISDTFYKSERKQIEIMTNSALFDMQEYFKFDSFNLHTLHIIDSHIDRIEVNKIIDKSDSNSHDNFYLVYIIEFGCAIAKTLENEIGGFVWKYETPYWESYLIHKPTLVKVNVFHWAIKKNSEDEVTYSIKNKILWLKENLNKPIMDDNIITYNYIN